MMRKSHRKSTIAKPMFKRDITLPPVHNTRAPEQWRIISQHVDFEGKTVLDLGCGYGDLLWRTRAAGATSVGVEIDYNARSAICRHAESVSVAAPLWNNLHHLDYLEDMDRRWDIAICFSVLPYLIDPTATLHWIHQHSTQALIECQLAGDGPGFDWLKSPQDLRRWLDSIGWQSVERIGETVVKDRGAKRGIWLCQ